MNLRDYVGWICKVTYEDGTTAKRVIKKYFTGGVLVGNVGYQNDGTSCSTKGNNLYKRIKSVEKVKEYKP